MHVTQMKKVSEVTFGRRGGRAGSLIVAAQAHFRLVIRQIGKRTSLKRENRQATHMPFPEITDTQISHRSSVRR
jgi:hypothetical protein